MKSKETNNFNKSSTPRVARRAGFTLIVKLSLCLSRIKKKISLVKLKRNLRISLDELLEKSRNNKKKKRLTKKYVVPIRVASFNLTLKLILW